LVKVAVEVTPRSRRPGIVGRRGDVVKVRVAAPPEGGRANDEVKRLLATLFAVGERGIRIRAGAGSRRKLFEIDGVTPAELTVALGRLPDLAD